jgi:hypothetical protein
LHLSNTALNDVGLVNVMGMTNLSVFNIDCTRVTDAGLSRLMGLTKLQYLNISNTRCIDDGADSLKMALPKTRIVW